MGIFTKWFKREEKAAPVEETRSYTDVVKSIKQQNPTWLAQRISAESDLTRSARELIAYSRELFRENAYLIAYGNEYKVNVIGPKGYRVRLTITEEEDREITDGAEKAFWRNWMERRVRVNDFLAKKGRPLLTRALPFTEKRGKVTIKAGEPDLFARQYIEREFKKWQRAEYCTITGKLVYNQSRIQRAKACPRDGEHFIHLIRNTQKAAAGERGWKYGFRIQHINAEWCDRALTVAESKGYKDEEGVMHGVGNPIRNGFEYDKETGLEVVAYWFIKADPNSWLGLSVNPDSTFGKKTHVRYPASDIIHYAMLEDDTDISRPAPWTVGIINTAKLGGDFMRAAVKAALVGACSSTYFETKLDGPDGMDAGQADPTTLNEKIQTMTPGGAIGLPPGIHANVVKPTYPNQDVGSFRNENIRELCAGLQGASHPVMAQNYAEINFSAGRLDRLSTTGAWQMLQEFDIETAERRIFEEWLKMALTVGAIKLPLRKFDKFNSVEFQGRRWAGIDPVKEVNAAASAIANKFTTRTAVIESGICGESADFEEIIMQLIEEEMILEAAGMSTATTAETQIQAPDHSAEELDAADAAETKPKKPKQQEAE